MPGVEREEARVPQRWRIRRVVCQHVLDQLPEVRRPGDLDAVALGPGLRAPTEEEVIRADVRVGSGWLPDRLREGVCRRVWAGSEAGHRLRELRPDAPVEDAGSVHQQRRHLRRSEAAEVPVRAVRQVGRQVVRDRSRHDVPGPARDRIALRRVGRAPDRRSEPLPEGAHVRPREADAVFVVRPHAPVEDGVGRIGLVARVRGRVGGDLVDRAAEAGVLGDLQPVGARAGDRRPLEARLVGEALAVGGGEPDGRRRPLVEALRRRREWIAFAAGPVEASLGQHGPVVERRLVAVGRRPERAARRKGGELCERVIDEGGEVRIFRHQHEVARDARHEDGRRDGSQRQAGGERRRCDQARRVPVDLARQRGDVAVRIVVALHRADSVVEDELVLRRIGRVVARRDVEVVADRSDPLRRQRQRVGASGVLQRLPRVTVERAPREERGLAHGDPALRSQVVARAEVPGGAGRRASAAVRVARPLERPAEAVGIEVRVVAIDLLAEGAVTPGPDSRAVLAGSERRQELRGDRVRIRIRLRQVPAGAERGPGRERDVAREVVLEQRCRPEASAPVERRHVHLVAGRAPHRAPAEDRHFGLIPGSPQVCVHARVVEVVAHPQVLDALPGHRRDVVEGLRNRARVLAGRVAVTVPDACVAVDVGRAHPPVVRVVREDERRRERRVDRRPVAAHLRRRSEVDRRVDLDLVPGGARYRVPAEPWIKELRIGHDVGHARRRRRRPRPDE